MKLDNGVYIHFLVEKKLKDELQQEAKNKGMPLNAYIRMLLIERSK